MIRSGPVGGGRGRMTRSGNQDHGTIEKTMGQKTIGQKTMGK